MMEKGFIRRRLGQPWHDAITLLPGGWELVIRPVRPEDAPRLREAFSRLTPEDVRFRFIYALTELTPAVAERLARPDPAREFALVATEPAPPGQAVIGADARAVISEDLKEAEFSIIVGRPLRGYGLARHLMRRIIEWCRKKRLDAVYGDVLAYNSAMLELARRLGFKLYTLPGEPDLTRVRLQLKR